ncbi:cytochrome b [Shinella sp.]|uniref:cytochrome b n=1 Tax=Shinella sp. TaxID=1870904 RepID=UPI003F70DDB6
MSRPHRFDAVAMIFHWGSALLLLLLFALGWRMVALALSPAKFELYALHKSLGLVALALACLRLLWRLFRGAPPPVEGPVWQRRAATAAHGLLYGLLFAMPLSGWLFNSLVGFPLGFFGLVDVPALSVADPAMQDMARLAHRWAGYGLLALIAAHVGAALHHRFVLRDGTLERMLPSWHLSKGNRA